MPWITLHLWFEESVWIADSWACGSWILESSTLSFQRMLPSCPGIFWPKDVAFSLELSLVTTLPKSTHSFTTLFFTFWEPLSLCCDVGRLLNKNPLYFSHLHFAGKTATVSILTLCSFRPHCILERSPPELPLPFLGMRRTLCKYNLYF